MKGLVLIAPEGINATVCGTEEAVGEWKRRMRELHPAMSFKDSGADAPVFRKWSVKRKPEIVAIKDPAIRPAGTHRHLSPAEWHALIARGDVTIIDTRNDYEVAIGKFTHAIDPGIRSFHEFPAYVRASGLPKDKKVLLYCTGGIRCEKAIIAMEDEGFTDVHQLDGGILAYLEQFPQGGFEGECFVFDERVAVDSQLRPSSTFTLCTGCGDPVAQTPLCAACS